MARWTWPDKAKRLGDWMSARALREFTSDPRPTANSALGRRVWFEQNGRRRSTFLERRPSGPGEAGMYQYRFVCGRSLKALYKAEIAKYAIEVESMGLKIYGFPGGREEGSPSLFVRSRYHPELPKAFKRMRGKWDSEYRVWVWRDESRFEQVHSFLKDFFGFEDGRFFDVWLSLEALEGAILEEEPIFSLGRQLLYIKEDSVRASPGVYFHVPTLSYTELSGIVVVVTRVPTSLYERHREELSECAVKVETHDEESAWPEGSRRSLPRELFAFPPEPLPSPAPTPWGSPFDSSRDSFF